MRSPDHNCLAWVATVLLTFSAHGEAVFERWEDNPLIPRAEGTWRSVSTANASLLPVGDRMHLYLRGTRQDAAGENREGIGLFTQPLAVFSPDGPWLEHPDNPVIPNGGDSDYDAVSALDTAAVLLPDGRVVVYYSAVSLSRDYAIAWAVSDDGGYTFAKQDTNPLKMHVGVCDAVFHDGEVYLFYADAKWNPETRRSEDRMRIWVVSSADPGNFDFTAARVALSPGDDSWDMYTVNGGRVFRLRDKWYMVYQGSDTHRDFPYRFHAAVSDDLLHWDKVNSDRPLMTRGRPGTWDQGAIWHGDVLAWNGTLHLYYEGWGSEGYTWKRNLPYYEGGYSQLGLARCSESDFLDWVHAGKQRHE
jgi:predicted GH43/DUF377 family glycosyl hydrolase